MTAKIAALAAVVSKLPAYRQSFANDLIAKAPRGLTTKQLYWVGELTRLALFANAPSREPAATVSIAPIIALLDRAAAKLKHPAIIVRANDRDIRLSIAGPTARAPGSVNVCSTGSWGDRDWFGRITRDGEFEPSRKYDASTISAVTLALQAMAADPAKAAADYGHLTGVCCFCNTPLTDGRSTEVGYGPTCAKHYGLPWGKKAAAPVAADLLDLARLIAPHKRQARHPTRACHPTKYSVVLRGPRHPTRRVILRERGTHGCHMQKLRRGAPDLAMPETGESRHASRASAKVAPCLETIPNASARRAHRPGAIRPRSQWRDCWGHHRAPRRMLLLRPASRQKR